MIYPYNVLIGLKKKNKNYLVAAVEFVGEFDLSERDGLLHPVSAEVGRVRVNVDAGRARPVFLMLVMMMLGFSTRGPVSVEVFPPARVGWNEVEQGGVHRGGVQTGDADSQHRKHPPVRLVHINNNNIIIIIIECTCSTGYAYHMLNMSAFKESRTKNQNVSVC